MCAFYRSLLFAFKKEIFGSNRWVFGNNRKIQMRVQPTGKMICFQAKGMRFSLQNCWINKNQFITLKKTATSMSQEKSSLGLRCAFVTSKQVVVHKPVNQIVYWPIVRALKVKSVTKRGGDVTAISDGDNLMIWLMRLRELDFKAAHGFQTFLCNSTVGEYSSIFPLGLYYLCVFTRTNPKSKCIIIEGGGRIIIIYG